MESTSAIALRPARTMRAVEDITEQIRAELRAGRLTPGAVLVFDEFFNYLGFELHEYKAFFEFVERFGVKYKFIGYSGQQVSVMIDAIHKPAG